MEECVWMNVNAKIAKIVNYFQKKEKLQFIMLLKNATEIKIFQQINYYLYKLVMGVNVNLQDVKKSIVNVSKGDKFVKTFVLVKIV